MTGERERIAVGPDYARDLGLAAYCFAVCEWNVVWCAEKLKSGYIGSITKKTAGRIAREFTDLVSNVPEGDLREELIAAASQFAELVDQRNGLFHGKPGTAKDGEQRLFRYGSEWTPEAIQEFSDRVSACSIELNRLLHSRLM